MTCSTHPQDVDREGEEGGEEEDSERLAFSYHLIAHLCYGNHETQPKTQVGSGTCLL